MQEDNDINQEKLDGFVEKVINDLDATMNSALVFVGDKLGLYKAMSKADSPLTSEELAKRTDTKSISKPNFIRRTFRLLGPGLITGASDDDPSGIATYSQAAARFGLGMLWMVLLLYPMMLTIEEMSGRIGLTTEKGLATITFSDVI